jgi:hypothetical protein
MSEKVIGRPFQPGQSGNPAGRPKSKPFREALDRAIKAASNDPDSKLTLDSIAAALLAKASTGDVPAIKELAERYDGKVAQAVIGGDEEDPEIKVSWLARS